jgi:RNA polymerase sigma-70 factor (ECF subfamily)
MMVPESDEAVFGRVQAGDRAAFAVLVERYQRRAFAVALRLLGGNGRMPRTPNRQLSGLQSRPRLFALALSTWFYRILTNTCIDWLRRARWRLGQQEFSTADTRACPRPARQCVTARRAGDRSRRGADVLTLYYGTATYREIAAIRGIAVNTVKTHLRRGRGALRKALRARGVDGP